MYRGYLATICFFLAVLVSGCATVNYDDQADQQLTALTQEINLQLISWVNQIEGQPTTPAAYEAKFYDKVQADITTLEIRMEASQDPATGKLVEIFASLNEQVDALRQLHMKQKTFSDAPFLLAEKNLLNAQIASLITFELSLKSAQTGSSSSAKTQSTAVATTAKKAAGASAKVQAGPTP